VGRSRIEVAGRPVAVDVVSFRGAQQPRLRFDKVAIAFIRRLQTSLSRCVPDGRTVIVTISAPIRQDSSTGTLLIDKIRELLAGRRAQLKATIHGNRIQVRVLKGAGSRTAKLIGFVHNPKPDPSVLFDVTRCLLACMGSDKRRSTADRWLVIANPDGLAPVETVRQVCSALRARTVFKRIVFNRRAGAGASRGSSARLS
jgi:hypothetical protein